MVTIPDIVLPDRLNVATVFLDHNLEAGRGEKPPFIMKVRRIVMIKEQSSLTAWARPARSGR